MVSRSLSRLVLCFFHTCALPTEFPEFPLKRDWVVHSGWKGTHGGLGPKLSLQAGMAERGWLRFPVFRPAPWQRLVPPRGRLSPHLHLSTPDPEDTLTLIAWPKGGSLLQINFLMKLIPVHLDQGHLAPGQQLTGRKNRQAKYQTGDLAGYILCQCLAGCLGQVTFPLRASVSSLWDMRKDIEPG